MRLALLIALAAMPAARAFAADTPAAGAEAGPPVCITTTVVVKRGDVVLSTTSKTRCEKASAAGARGGAHPEAVLNAPEAMLKASDSVLGSFSFFGGDAEALSLRNVPADWRVIDVRTGHVCHLVLEARPGPSGLPVRSEGCQGALGRASTWSFDNGTVNVLASDGSGVVRLAGDRSQLSGRTSDGDQLQLQR